MKRQKLDPGPLMALGFPAQEATRLAGEYNDALTLNQPPARPASPSRLPSNPTSSRPTKAGRTAGNPPKGKKKKALKRAKKGLGAAVPEVRLMMRNNVAPELTALWTEQLADGSRQVDQDPTPKAKRMTKRARKALLAVGVDPGEVKVMQGADCDLELHNLWVHQLAGEPEPAADRQPDETEMMAGADPELEAIWLSRPPIDRAA